MANLIAGADYPGKPRVAQTEADGTNTQTPQVRLGSHLLQITKALLTKAGHVPQIQACENLGCLRYVSSLPTWL